MKEKKQKEFATNTHNQSYMKNNFNQKGKMIRSAFILFTAFVFFCAIIYTWVKIRYLAFKTANKIIIQRVKKNTECISKTIEGILQKYRLSSNLLIGMNEYDGLINCSIDNLFQFVKYAKTIHKKLNVSPTRVYLQQENQNYCEISFSNDFDESIYNLYFYESSNMIFKKFDQTVDLSNFDFKNDGIKIPYCNNFLQKNPYNFLYPCYLNDYSKQIMSIVSYGNNFKAFTGLSLTIESLTKKLIPLTKLFSFRTVVTMLDNRVLIEGEQGVIKPLSIEKNNNPIYPSLEQIDSDFWKQIATDVIKIPNGEFQNIMINDEIYFAYNHIISIENISILKLISVIQFDQYLSNIFIPVSYGSITFFIFIVLITSLFLFFQKKGENERSKKLEKEQLKHDSFVFGKQISLNGLSKAIFKLRSLQLRFPEDPKFNKVLDNIVSDLAGKKTSLFSVELKPNCDCEFCQYLIPPKPIKVQDQKFPAFSKWPSYISSRFIDYESLGTLDFHFQEHIDQPVKQLIRLFITIIKKENLLFAQFDPDLLIQFMYKFASICCKDVVHTAHVMFSIYYLLHGKFKYWLSQKIDHFIIYFVAFVYQACCIIPYESSSGSYTESMSESMKENKSNDDSEEDAVQALRFHMNVFNDDTSEVARNLQLVFDLFHEFIPRPNVKDDLVEYFFVNVKDLFYSVQEKNQFSLINEFSIRIESPYFSVLNEQNDKILFMKSLFKLCDYCSYWCSTENMIKATNRITNELFEDPTIVESFIAEFHYEYALTIVSPWISIFIHFNSLDEIVENFNNNINYWKSKKK